MATAAFPWLTQPATEPRGGRFRVGQWVKFKPVAPIAGAHVTGDGFTVGIYRPGRRQSRLTIEDGDGQATIIEVVSHERVVVVTPDGNNLPYVDESGNVSLALWFPPDACPELRPVTRREDIPAARIADNPHWTPEP